MQQEERKNGTKNHTRRKNHNHAGHAVATVFSSPAADQDSNVNRIYTLETDRGVQIGLAARGDRAIDDDMPAYVEQVAIVGPLVCVYAYAPPATVLDTALEESSVLDPEYQCYVLARSELRKHPALAALLQAQGTEQTAD